MKIHLGNLSPQDIENRAGSMDMAIKIRDILAKYEKDMKGQIHIGINQSA